MKRAFFFILLFASGFIYAQNTIQPAFEASLDKLYYQAASAAILTVTLENYNNDKWYMEDVKVSIESNAIISYEPLTRGPVSIDINDAKTFVFKFRLKNLPNGEYDLVVKYFSHYWCAATPVRPQSGEKIVTIKIDNSEPSLSLMKTEFAVEEGETFNLVFINEGVIAKNAHFNMISDASFEYKGSLGYITGTAAASVKIKEKPGTYKAYVNLVYFNKLGEERKSSIPIYVKVLAPSTTATSPPHNLVASLTQSERKATFSDYLPFYAFGIFLILLFSALILIVARMQ